MRHWAAGSRAKVERAKKHFRELDLGIRSFFDSGTAYEKVPDNDPKTGDALLRLHWVVEPPLFEWGAIAGDVIHNLWAALEVAMKQAVWAKTGRTTSRGWTILRNKKAFERANFGDISRCGPSFLQVYRATHPYQGGKTLIWMLPELDNNDKHWELTTVGIGPMATYANFSPETSAVLFPEDKGKPFPDLIRVAAVMGKIWPHGPESSQEGAILQRIPAAIRDKVVDMEPSVSFDIALHPPDGIDARPILRLLLAQLTNNVDAIVADLEAIP